MRFESIPRALVAAALLAATLAGCVHVPRHDPGRNAATPVAAHIDPVVELLEYAHTLEAGTPEQRAQAVIAARESAIRSPGAWHYARLAVAYGMPEQRRYTPDEAARYAQRALDADNARWSDAARQYLRDYARMYGAMTRPVSADDSAAETGNQRRSSRVVALQAELDEARRKLRELADIEDRLSTSDER